MNVDRTTPDLICIQFRSDELSGIVDSLHELMATRQRWGWRGDGDQLVALSFADSGIAVDASDPSMLCIQMGLEELTDLVDAIAQHVHAGEKWPLDHALEPLGATIVPSSIKDVVFETI